MSADPSAGPAPDEIPVSSNPPLQPSNESLANDETGDMQVDNEVPVKPSTQNGSAEIVDIPITGQDDTHEKDTNGKSRHRRDKDRSSRSDDKPRDRDRESSRRHRDRSEREKDNVRLSATGPPNKWSTSLTPHIYIYQGKSERSERHGSVHFAIHTIHVLQRTSTVMCTIYLFL